MGFSLENLGTWTDYLEFEVEASRAKAYARATNDPTPEHSAGLVAPPNFAVVPLFETGAFARAMERVVDLPPTQASRAVHGEHDLVVHQPIRPGMVLRVRGAAVGVLGKSTGTIVVTRFETVDVTGAPVNTQSLTAFFRGVPTDRSGGEAGPEQHTSADAFLGPPIATVKQRFDADQTSRYATASGDHTPIHVDDAAAKAAGLPGVIIHGLCTMAVAGHGVVSAVVEERPVELRRLAVRFSSPAFPSDEITTKIWACGRREATSVFAFETIGPDGSKILANGLAEIVEL